MSTRTEYRDRLIETLAERDNLLAVNAELVRALERAEAGFMMINGRGYYHFDAVKYALPLMIENVRSALAKSKGE